MIKKTIKLAVALLVLLLFSTTFTLMAIADSRNMGDDGNIPVICTPDCGTLNFSKSIVALDTLENKFPGHIVTMPLSVEIDEEKEITEMAFNLNAQTGITFDDVVSSGEWNGSITVVNEDSELYIRFHNNPSGQTFGELTKIADIDIEIAANRDFNTSYSISHDAEFPDIRTTEDDHCKFQTRNTGLIKLSGGQVSLWVDSTTAYSYQGHDIDPETGDPAKYILIEMPVFFNSEFPVDSFVMDLDVYDLLASGDTIKFEPNPAYSASFTGSDRYRFLTDNRDGMDPYLENTDIWLGTLKARGQDYETDYETLSFSTSDYVVITGDPVDDDIFYCDGTSLQKSAQEDSILYTNGKAYYPVYRCSTFVASDTVDVDLSVTIPVTVNHSFYSQDFEYFISYDSTCLSLESVDTSGCPQSVASTPVDTTGTIITNKVNTSGLNQDGAYVHPDSLTPIFNLNFTATDSFALGRNNSTTVSINITSFENWVYDYFHASGNKIKRESDDTNYFYVSSGTIEVDETFAVSIDSVNCAEDTTDIPVNLEWLTLNNEDSLSFKISIESTLRMMWIVCDGKFKC
jgi:hypothetical protein